ncbi:hypothetical protein CQ13_21645 [Bradyrhizobium retamae]|uniref:Uncharacterized protein n=1 Tax=Bradyrhizobium retamae TaxID=1300035 RepID=A0A0R3NDW9_9BRAD|nr:hypothetical protein CQ13_21645 [Bradyrhizobium retamae]
MLKLRRVLTGIGQIARNCRKEVGPRHDALKRSIFVDDHADTSGLSLEPLDSVKHRNRFGENQRLLNCGEGIKWFTIESLQSISVRGVIMSLTSRLVMLMIRSTTSRCARDAQSK